MTLDYAPNFGGFPMLPWNAIVGTDQILYLSQDLYEPSGDSLFMSEVLEVFDQIFAPVVEPDQLTLDFGHVPSGTTADLPLVIYNGGTGLLEITDITSSSPDFSVDVTQGQVLAIDDQLDVTVTFAPTQYQVYDETLTIHSPSGNGTVTLGGNALGVVSEPGIPQEYGMTCYPNPFNAELTIQINLPSAQDVNVAIYDVQGRQQTELWNGTLNAGSKLLRWADREAPSGVYFIEVQGTEWNQVEKVLMIR